MNKEKKFFLFTLGTCGLNSTARCMASTADISAPVKPRLLAISGENLLNQKKIKISTSKLSNIRSSNRSSFQQSSCITNSSRFWQTNI